MPLKPNPSQRLMQRKKAIHSRSKLFVYIVLAGLFLGACQNNTLCDPTAQPSLKFGFYGLKRYPRPYIDSPIAVLVSNVYALNALVAGSPLLPLDTLGQDTVHRLNLSLPVSAKTNSSSYVIVVNTNPGGIGVHSTNDTLKINYSKKLVFISTGCGYGYSYGISGATITHHYFAQLDTISKSIDPNVPENFRLIHNNL